MEDFPSNPYAPPEAPLELEPEDREGLRPVPFEDRDAIPAFFHLFLDEWKGPCANPINRQPHPPTQSPPVLYPTTQVPPPPARRQRVAHGVRTHTPPEKITFKLAASMFGISRIHPLKSFVKIHNENYDDIKWKIFIHITFLGSAILLAWTDKIMQKDKKH